MTKVESSVRPLVQMMPFFSFLSEIGRIQELRNKRWAAITRAKAKAERVKQDYYASEEEKKEATREAEKVFNDFSQKSWSLLGWFNPVNWASSGGSGCGEPDTVGDG